MSFLQQREDESKCFHHSWGKGEVVAIGIHFSGIGGTATRFHMNAMGESRLQGVDEVIAGGPCSGPVFPWMGGTVRGDVGFLPVPWCPVVEVGLVRAVMVGAFVARQAVKRP